MSVINKPVSLAPGCPVKLTNNGQVTASGNSLQFVVPKRPDAGEFSLALQIVGNPSGLTSQLQADFSSGALGTNLANYFGAGPTASGITVIGTANSAPIVAGGPYQLNVTALTSDTFDVWAVIN